jgi:hypothetical protein
MAKFVISTEGIRSDYSMEPHAVKDAMVHLICVGSVRIRFLFLLVPTKSSILEALVSLYQFKADFRVNLLA